MNIGKGMLEILMKVALVGTLAIGSAASAAGFTVLNNVPPAVAKGRLVAHHNPNAVLDIRVALPFQNGAQLSQLLHDLYDRTSPNYRHFLTPSQFAARFGYTSTDPKLLSLVQFLESHGIKVTGFSYDNTRVHAIAKASVLERAFSVTINDYSYRGRKFYAPNRDPHLPATVIAPVMAVLGLDDAVTFRPHNLPGKPTAAPRAVLGPHGYMPQDIATVYNMPDVTDATNGAGATIAIATVYNFRPQDLKTFWIAAGVPVHTGPSAVTVVAVDGKATKVLNGETTLDIERSGSVAPGAAIKVYECVNPAFVNFDDEFSEIAGDAAVQVVTTSWGAPEGDMTQASLGSEHQSFVAMAVEGMTMFAAAGDASAGDATGDDDRADYPSSDPYVVSAGGSTLVIDPNTGLRDTETVWGDGQTNDGGAGGADSIIFAAPSYQTTPITGLTPNTSCPKDLTAAPGAATDFGATTVDLCAAADAPSRQNSDMALDADPFTGYAIYYNGRWEEFGGTSFVAPELAGYFADVLQQAIAIPATLVNGRGLGYGNQLIYCAGTGPNYATDFFDVTDGSNGFDAGAGWDHPTGFGTIRDGASLATDLIGCLPP